MDETILEWRNYRYFPYERSFASLEAERLFCAKPREHESGLRIPSAKFCTKAAERLTYFARAVHPDGSVVVPYQMRLEASATGENRERQSTRYSAHGLHEYKGKFNPQVVRAIGNMLGLNEDARVLDPFCGSGTTLLECAHNGWSAFGIDRNPLAIRISNAKLRAVHRADGPLEEMTEAIIADLAPVTEALSGSYTITISRIETELGGGWEGELPAWDYLSSWFPLPVLAQVVAIRRSIRANAATREDRDVFDVVLSDHLRDVSLQEPADLRIRRRKEPDPNYPLIGMYVQALRERVRRVARARTELGALVDSQKAVLSDIRTIDLLQAGGAEARKFDAVITSPPYETALPYVDTQRLSLVLLGDVKATDIQRMEKELIGAREIGVRERREFEDAIRSGSREVPSTVLDLCRHLLDAAKRPGNGFRRINRPALAFRYFRSMAGFFMNVRHSLQPGAKVALVVGSNRTVLGGQEYEIDTPRLLADVAEHCGYSRVEEQPMNTYQRYDLHQKNSINTETLIVLSAPNTSQPRR